MLKNRIHLLPPLFTCCFLLFCSTALRSLQAQTSPPSSGEAPKLEFVFEEVVTLDPGVHPGATPWGDRNIIPITGGKFSGPKIKGKVLPGGWDWQLATQTGCFKIQADYMIETDDGAIINVVNKGVSCKSVTEKQGRLLTTPVFEAPVGAYEWLNGGAYVGTLDGATIDGKPAVRIRFYKAF
jgi:hypothetical protein